MVLVRRSRSRSRSRRSRRRSSRRGRQTKRSQRRLAGGVGVRRPFGDVDGAGAEQQERIQRQRFTLTSPDFHGRAEYLKDAVTGVARTGNYEILATFDTSEVTSFKQVFNHCGSMPNVFFAGITQWDTSSLEFVDQCFDGCIHFNQPLQWDFSHVLGMNGTFTSCSSFNQNINHWNLTQVQMAERAFRGCGAFNNGNAPLVLRLPSVFTVKQMFEDCRSLNVDIALENVDRLLDARSFLKGCTSFMSGLELGFDQENRRFLTGMLLDNASYLGAWPFDGRAGVKITDMLTNTALLANQDVQEAILMALEKRGGAPNAFKSQTGTLPLVSLQYVLHMMSVTSRNVRTRAFTGSGRLFYAGPYSEISVD